MTEVVATESVLEREQAFFDHEAAALSDRELVIDPSQTRRYREARLRAGNIPKDTLFARLQPLAGKRVLDYGCGTGESTCHLANCGAEVTAFDLSPESVAVARRRADLNGLGGRIRFDVYRAGETGYTAGSFDAIIGFAILHHLHEMLPTIYKEIRTLLARREGRPTSSSRWPTAGSSADSDRWLRCPAMRPQTSGNSSMPTWS